MKTAKASWKGGHLFVTCPHCKRKHRGGVWLAAHADEVNRHGVTFTCRKEEAGCGKKSELVSIPRAPRTKR